MHKIMFNKISAYLPSLSSIKSFTPDLGKTAHKAAEIVKDGTVFFVVAVGMTVGAGFAVLFQVEGAVDDQVLLVLMGAVASLVLGFFLHSISKNSKSTSKTPQEEPVVIPPSTLQLGEPPGLPNGCSGDYNFCFANVAIHLINMPFLRDHFYSIIDQSIQDLAKEHIKVILKTPLDVVFSLFKKDVKAFQCIKHMKAFQCVKEVMEAYKKAKEASYAFVPGVCLTPIRELFTDATRWPGVQGDATELLYQLMANAPGNSPLLFNMRKEKTWEISKVHENASRIEVGKDTITIDKLNEFQNTTSNVEPFVFFPLRILQDESQKLSLLFQKALKFTNDDLCTAVYKQGSHIVEAKVVSEEIKFTAGLPKHLFFHLKRFTENSTKITTPLALEDDYKLLQVPHEGKLVTYELQAVIWHDGSCFGGHYTFLNAKEGWKASDLAKTKADEEMVKDYIQNGYIYFYSKKPVQEAGKIVIGNVDEQPNHQDNEGDNELLHRPSSNGLLSDCFDTSKENMTSV